MVNRRGVTVGCRSAIRTWPLAICVALSMFAVLFAPRASLGDEVAVPIALQAELVAKVASYDRNLAARAGDRVHVLIIVKAKDDASSAFAKHMESALGGVDKIGGLPHDEVTAPFGGAKALADACRSKRISIVYLAPGLGDEVAGIRAALDGVNVLSVAADAADVARGIVLGFDLVSGKPKIVVHLGQAKRQEVSFKAELLKLAKVLE
jgi:hypothetical protein